MLRVAQALVIAFAVLLVAPMALAITASFDSLRIPLVPPRIIPRWTLANYRELLAANPVGLWTANSLGLATASAAGATLLAISAGYGFCRKRFAGKELLFAVIVIACTVPDLTIMLPKFLMVKKLGLYDTRLGLVLPFLGSAGTVFFAREYFRGFPAEYIDEARINGAGELTVFFRVVLPVSGPVVGLSAIGLFLGAYNNYLWQLLLIRDNRLLTLPLGMQEAMARYLAKFQDGMPAYSYGAAGAVLAFLPMLAVFLIFQKRLIGGFYGRARG